MTKPVVSILSITYNHEKFVAQALESFLMQKTDFDFEIIIADDASTDNNQEIIKEIRDKYPKFVKPILRSQNIGANANFFDAFTKCKGKYIAMCEGDDYWTDPYKLQKQVDFLELNEGYSFVHSDYDCLNETNGQVVKNQWASLRVIHDISKNCAPLIICQKYLVQTLTVCFHRELLNKIFENYPEDFSPKYLMGDTQLWYHLSKCGEVGYLNESSAVYRKHKDGVTTMIDLEKRICFLNNANLMKTTIAKRDNHFEALTIINKNHLKMILHLYNRCKDNKKTIYYLFLLLKHSCFSPKEKFSNVIRLVKDRILSV